MANEQDHAVITEANEQSRTGVFTSLTTEEILRLAEKRARFLRRYFKENLPSEVKEVNGLLTDFPVFKMIHKRYFYTSPLWCISDYFISAEDAEGENIVATEVRNERVFFERIEVALLSLPVSFITCNDEEAIRGTREAYQTLWTAVRGKNTGYFTW